MPTDVPYRYPAVDLFDGQVFEQLSGGEIDDPATSIALAGYSDVWGSLDQQIEGNGLKILTAQLDSLACKAFSFCSNLAGQSGQERFVMVEVQKVIGAARMTAFRKSLSRAAERELVVGQLLEAFPSILAEEAERLWKIDRGDDLDNVEETALELVCDHGHWAPELANHQAQLARSRGEIDAADRWEACFAKVMALLRHDVAACDEREWDAAEPDLGNL